MKIQPPNQSPPTAGSGIALPGDSRPEGGVESSGASSAVAPRDAFEPGEAAAGVPSMGPGSAATPEPLTPLQRQIAQRRLARQRAKEERREASRPGSEALGSFMPQLQAGSALVWLAAGRILRESPAANRVELANRLEPLLLQRLDAAAADLARIETKIALNARLPVADSDLGEILVTRELDGQVRDARAVLDDVEILLSAAKELTSSRAGNPGDLTARVELVRDRADRALADAVASFQGVRQHEPTSPPTASDRTDQDADGAAVAWATYLHGRGDCPARRSGWSAPVQPSRLFADFFQLGGDELAALRDAARGAAMGRLAARTADRDVSASELLDAIARTSAEFAGDVLTGAWKAVRRKTATRPGDLFTVDNLPWLAVAAAAVGAGYLVADRQDRQDQTMRGAIEDAGQAGLELRFDLGSLGFLVPGNSRSIERTLSSARGAIRLDAVAGKSPGERGGEAQSPGTIRLRLERSGERDGYGRVTAELAL